MLLRLVFLAFWRTSRYLLYRKTILYVTSPCFYTAWFLLTMIYYSDFTPSCYEPYPSYGLFVFCIVMVLIMPAAFLVICITSFLILFCPCIVYTLGKAYYDQRQAAHLKTKVVKSLSKITYGQIKLDGQNECAICLGDFHDDQLITPLSCDIRHFFHFECIQQWMKQKNECPLCKAVIEPANLKELNKEL